MACLLGLAYAAHSGIRLNGTLALITLLGALLAHAGINVLNDYYDAINGSDDNNSERIYPYTGGSRFIQNGVLSLAQTRSLGLTLLCASAALGLLLTGTVGWALLPIGACGLFVGWAYSAPPLMLNARGWGEICVALGFGALIPLGSDLVQRGNIDWGLLRITAPFALLVTNILYINQFPDWRADAAAGKHHWVVRLGPARAPWVYLTNVFLALLAGTMVLTEGHLAAAGWVALPPLALALLALVLLFRHRWRPARLGPAIQLTIAAALGHGLLLAAALLAS